MATRETILLSSYRNISQRAGGEGIRETEANRSQKCHRGHAQSSSAETCDIVGADHRVAGGAYRYGRGALRTPPSLHPQISSSLLTPVFDNVEVHLGTFDKAV